MSDQFIVPPGTQIKLVFPRAGKRPEPGYEPAEPGLEDVYFAAMRGTHAPNAALFAADADAAAPAFGSPDGAA